jgi:hypothetical protein
MSSTLQLGVNYNYFKSQPGTGNKPAPSVIARVEGIILGPRTTSGDVDKNFKANGEWASVGGILYTVLYQNQSTDLGAGMKKIALPINSAIKKYPLKGELVELVVGPSPGMNDGGASKQYYYREPYNLWGSTHHNAFPDLTQYSNFTQAQQTGYAATEAGATYSNVSESISYPLGGTFKEKSDIKNLQYYEGDSIVEGRWGQSIRLGSTVKGKGIANPWSSQGTSGDPIIIIRNGQGKQTVKEAWIPTIEDINSDASSIYICSGQSIYIKDLDNYPMTSYASRTKPTVDQVQTRNTVPLSTDSTSAQSQAQNQLKIR